MRTESCLLDLSVAVDPDYWEPEPIRRWVIDHRRGADLLGRALGATSKWWFGTQREWLKQLLGRGVDHRNFPDEKGLSLMIYRLTTHTGTHMDAPFHYGDVDAKGRMARTIDEVPLDWCYGDGVLLDVAGDAECGPVSKAEVTTCLERIGHTLKPMEIVLIRTNGDEHVGSTDYFTRFRGVSREALAFILDHGVKVVGVDSFGFDPPFGRMLTAYQTTRDPDELWPAHLYGRKREYCQLERLTNLHAIPTAVGFKVACFPVKLNGADASWCRVVAIIAGEAQT